MQFVRLAKVLQRNPGAVERVPWDFFAVQLAAVERLWQEVDEGFGAWLVTEKVDRRFAGEGIGILREIKGNVVERRVNQFRPPAGFIARQIIFRIHP